MKKINRPWVIVPGDTASEELIKRLLPKGYFAKKEIFEYKKKVKNGYIFRSLKDIPSQFEVFLEKHESAKVEVFKKIRGTYAKCKLRNLRLFKRSQWIDTRR